MGKNRNKIIELLCLLLFFFFPQISAATADNKPQPLTVEQFIDKMVQTNHFDRDELVRLFQKTAYVPEVIDRMNTPFEEKPWDFYKNFFITDKRVQDGVNYWRTHQTTLDTVEKTYGVPPSVIIAIIGIESNYEQQPSKFPELGTLATLSFKYPKRALFFQSELENFLLLTREHNLEPLKVNGSYGGALGIPQFMPSNYRQIAVTLDENRTHANLLTNGDDAIASIANFLQKKGWKNKAPVAFPAKIKGSVKKWLLSANAKPTYRTFILNKFGIHAPSPVPPFEKAALITLHNTNNDEYWLTYGNFYAIMAYNPRTTYAMAIYQFSQALQKAYDQGTVNSASPTKTTPE